MEVKIQDTRIVNKNNLLSTHWITLTDNQDVLSLRVLLLQGQNGKYIALPTDTYTDDTGAKRYRKLVTLGEDLYRRVLDHCVQEFSNASRPQATMGSTPRTTRRRPEEIQNRPVNVPILDNEPVIPESTEPQDLVDEVLGSGSSTDNVVPPPTQPNNTSDNIDDLLEEDLKELI